MADETKDKKDKGKMYCVKCREKRDGKNHEDVIMKNKKKAMRAICEACGTKMFKIVGNA